MKNLIGLEKSKAEALAKALNELLASYQMFYQNLRGFHWNIKGREFFELHLKFEEFYNDAQEKIDEIAERILTLDETPLHTFSDYLNNSRVKEAKNVSDGVKGVEITKDNFQKLLDLERKIFTLASEAGDEGTATLISDYITQTEKTLWMLNAYLS